MGEILGIGMSHVPYMMNAPENMLRLRQVLMKVVERIEKRPFQDPPEALEQLGNDPEAVAGNIILSIGTRLTGCARISMK